MNLVPHRKPSRCALLLFAWVIAMLIGLAKFPVTAEAQTFQVLHEFQGPDGSGPGAGLTLDRGGNLYGTTASGGTNSGGTAFKLTERNSHWVLDPLHNFPDPTQGGHDGYNPAESLTIGPDGNLYGTTFSGGTGQYCCGVVFKLSPPISICKTSICPWIETILHQFTGASGAHPSGPVIFDQAGNLYGVTSQGGSANKGVVYQLTRSQSGWRETVLYSFTGSTDGPAGNLLFDATGNLYGTVGSTNCGSVFQLSSTQLGWSENIVYAFQGGSDGCRPYGLVFDSANNLYGATASGTVYELVRSAGSWSFNLLYTSQENELVNPSVLTFGPNGNLYGTSWGGDVGSCIGNGCGSVFTLSRSGSQWNFAYVHSFVGSDGGNPTGGVVFDSLGNLYGTASDGGDERYCDEGDSYGCGVVWEITP